MVREYLIKPQILTVLLGSITLALFIGCKKDRILLEATPDGTVSPVVKKDSAIEAETVKPAVKYTSFIFPAKKKDSAMAVFTGQFSEQEQYTILALNRLDDKNKWRADTLAIPDVIDHTLMAYSPFPETLQLLEPVNKMVLFSYPVQAYALYEKGKLVKWGPTSMGKKSAQTKRGLMFTNWKKELAISTVDSEWKLPYNFNVHNTLGIGWHQYDLPGFPASHSCMRLLMEDAKFMYKWADQWVLSDGGATKKASGTPVIVMGDYNWGGKKPWKNLVTDSKATDISVAELNLVIEPHLAEILAEQQHRSEVLTQISAKPNSKPAA